MGQRKGRAGVNTESVTFHWLSACQERRLSASCTSFPGKVGSAVITGPESSPSVLLPPFKINQGGELP